MGLSEAEASEAGATGSTPDYSNQAALNKISMHIAILGAGLTGCSASLNLANKGIKVTLFDRLPLPMSAASLHNEGKLHLGYVYAMDAEKQTQLKMIEGSLQFLGILEYLTGVDRGSFTLSSPFLYAVPKGSMLSFSQVLNHFNTVDRDISAFMEAGGEFISPGQPRPSKKKHKWLLSGGFNFKAVEGVIATGEVSVNPLQVANIVSTSVLTNDNITFKGNCEIERAANTGDGRYELFFKENEVPASLKFDAVINCLWEDRLKIDKTAGIETDRQNLTRFKATITLSGEYAKVPSVTFIVGAYGDVVNYNSGEFYLSWYPACKLGETTGDDLQSIKDRFAQLDKPGLIADSIRELSNLMPGILRIKGLANTGKVGGGFICGWGKTDITDYQSGLHKRSNIGVETQGRWLSVNTGKYCTAPLFGLEASNQLLSLL